ncbi:MAG: hypothetical protein ACTSUO_08425 [Candidatus Thorarchaeota archaeon]
MIKNIVVIRKEEDNVYRGYYQKYDDWCKYLCDYMTGLVHTQNGSVYSFREDELIFEASDRDEAMHRYHEWIDEVQSKGYCNCGYTFECVRPDSTVERDVKVS